MSLTRGDLEMIRQLIASMMGTTPPVEPPVNDPPQSPLQAFLNQQMEALIEDLAADMGDKLQTLVAAWQHYVAMYRAYRHGEEPTLAEQARAFTLALANGVEEGMPDSDGGRALAAALNATICKGISAPRVWLARPDWLGRTDRPMQAADMYWQHPVTGGSGGTWSGPPEPPTP